MFVPANEIPTDVHCHKQKIRLTVVCKNEQKLHVKCTFSGSLWDKAVTRSE